MAESVVLVKPCEAPCPKCGSQDILREFRARGDRFKSDEYDRCRSKYAQAVGWSSTSDRDHIHHHCRCCQYAWQTLPLKKPANKKATTP